MGWLRENAKELLDKVLSQASLSIANACGGHARGGKVVREGNPGEEERKAAWEGKGWGQG